MTLSVIGLGKLGAPLAVCLAQAGFAVLGVDSNPAILKALEQSPESFTEPGLGELWVKHRERLQIGSDVTWAVRSSEVSFLVVPTPSDEAGNFSLECVTEACRSVAQALAAKSDYHLIVLVSTVMPQDSLRSIVPALEAASGKTCGRDFGYCYSPEFIALGSVIRDMQNPDLVLIGQYDERSGILLEEIYQGLCRNRPPIIRTATINAEIAKLALNTYVTMKISFANTLARLCEATAGADCQVVSAVLGRDSRIGSKYLKGGLAFGGPCFPRDTVAFSNYAHSVGLEAPLAEVSGQINELQRVFLAERVESLMGGRTRLGVLGLAYKPDTSVVEQSPAVDLLVRATRQTWLLWAYDPLATETARRVLGDKVQLAPARQSA